MTTKKISTTRLLARFFAGGILLSMIIVYLLHFYGTWTSGIERPDAETTSSVVVYNKCAVLGDTHLLRPGASSAYKEGSNELKFAGSFMNFFDGHISVLILLAFILAIIMFGIKKASLASLSTSNQ